MNEWNTTKTLICIECRKRFDEDESPYICFCSDTCKRISTYRTWGKILRIEDMQKQMKGDE